MARETLKDFLTSIGKSSDKISFTRKNSPDGLGVDPNTGEELLDLANEVKGLLGDYLNFLVEDSSNTYKINPGNEMAASSNRGDSLTIADEQGASSVYVKQGTNLTQKLNEYSNSLNFDNSGTQLNSILDKTGATGDSHTLLSDVQGRPLSDTPETLSNPSGDESDVVQATHKMFLQNNRFANVGNSQRNSFSVNSQDMEEFESINNNRGTINLQKNFGKYDKNNFKTSLAQLKNLGASLLFKATGFDSGTTPDSSENILNIEGKISEGQSNSVNVNNTSGYIKQDVNNLMAKNAKGFPSDSNSSVRAGRGSFITNDPNADTSKSFGSTYNSSMTFSSRNKRVHKIQAALSVIALKAIAGSFYDTFSTYLKKQDEKFLQREGSNFAKTNSVTHLGAYMLGQSRNLTSLILESKLFNSTLTSTVYPYPQCVDRGIEVMFGSDNEAEKIAAHDNFSQSHGFWMAVSNSVLKSYDNVINRLALLDTASYSGKDIIILIKEVLETNKFIQFYNVAAVIGEMSLRSTNSVFGEKGKNFRDVNVLENKPGNRVGKSRSATPSPPDDNYIGGKNTLAWEQSATPSSYLLPVNIIRAASLLDNTVVGESPTRAMLGSRMVRNTYTSLDVDGTFNRIPNRVVKILEDKLEAEYVPFYFHDLRTNEIISFHAFLDQLVDSITTDYNSTSGYGRIDPVQTYRGTTRNLQVGFTVMSTNREDFDEMWFKINKLVTMLYPQWTQGTLVSPGAGRFYQPFSQVVGASPIVRLRVGDVVKSNYSRFALARIFGIGDKEVIATPGDSEFSVLKLLLQGYASDFQEGLNKIQDVVLLILIGLVGSPIGLVSAIERVIPTQTGMAGTATRIGSDVAVDALSSFLVNGFANPFAVANIIGELKDPNVSPEKGHTTGVFNLRKVIIKPNTVTGYHCIETGEKFFTNLRLTGRVLNKIDADDPLGKVANSSTQNIAYSVLVIEPGAPLNGKVISVAHKDILPDPKEEFINSILGTALFATDITGLLDLFLEGNNVMAFPGGGALTSLIRSLLASPESRFMDASNNPFTRAYDTTKGRGLAGVIKGFTFNWIGDDIPWETDYNARAPMGCKISFSFDVIHDIPPGLDHSGFNRAPLYNVGEIMRNVSGDVYGDNGAEAERNFKSGGTVTKLGSKTGK